MLENFSFHEVTEGKNRQEILRLDGTEATLVADISAEMLKSSIDMHTSILQKIIDLSWRNGWFPADLKTAKVRPVFKKYNNLDKENYRSVSVYLIFFIFFTLL